MFCRLLIAVALLAAPTVALAHSIGATHRHVKGSRILRIMIKKTRAGSQSAVRVTSDASSPASLGEGGVTIANASTGALIDRLALSAPRGGRILAGTILDGALDANDPISLIFHAGEVRADGSLGDDAMPVEVPIELIAGEGGRVRGDGAGPGGWKARVRVDGAGVLSAVIGNENRRWAGEGITGLAIQGAEGVVDLPIDVIRQVRVATTDADLEAAGAVRVDAEIAYGDGALVRSEIEAVSPAAPELTKVTARETGDGDAKLVSLSTGEGTTFAVDLVDAATGVPAIQAVDATPVATVRSFYAGQVEFDDDPAGAAYLLIVDRVGHDGHILGAQHEVELIAPPAVDGEVTAAHAHFGDGLGIASLLRDDEGFHLAVGLRDSAEVAEVYLSFEEPYEGPTPLEAERALDFIGQTNKWIQKGDGPLPAQYTVTTTLTDAEGQVVGGGVASGEGVGVVTRTEGNGKGTRKASAQAEEQHLELL